MYLFGCDRGMLSDVVTRGLEGGGGQAVVLLLSEKLARQRAFVGIEVHMRRRKCKARTVVPERAAWGTKRFRAVSSNLNS